MLAEILTIIAGVLVCGGFWAFVQYMVSRHDGKKEAMHELQDAVHKLQSSMDSNAKNMDLQSEALMALAQDRIVFLGKEFLKQGWVFLDDYVSLKRMADAYKALGGNAMVKEVMDEVDKLPHRGGLKFGG